MSSFSALLSSLDSTSEQSSTVKNARNAKSVQTSTKPAAPSDRFKLSTGTSTAGVKRKFNETSSGQPTGNARLESSPAKPAAGGNRFKLTANTKAPSTSPARPTSSSTQPSKLLRTNSTQSSGLRSIGPSSNATTATPASQKKGFAAILEQAKARQAEAQAATAGGIKHKPTEKMTRRERLRMMAEHKAQKKTGKPSTIALSSGPNSMTGLQKAGGGNSRNGTVAVAKKTTTIAQPLAYKGTMHKAGTAPAKPAPKERQLRPNEYADWSDLDEMEDYDDEEEGGAGEDDYGSEESDDMEGGFEDVMEEEELALKSAKKEDLEALQEEERLKQEKLARKRKLQELSKSAAGKKRY